MGDILDVIKSRKSVKKYKSDPVPKALIEKIVEAGTYASLRERSEQEIVQRLRRVHFHETTIARVMETLAGHHLYSDQRFAETWVSRRSRKYGRQRIAMELKMKGVSAQTARQALEGLETEEELSSAVRQAEKTVRRVQGDEQKLIQALVRRGYSWAVARQAAQAALKHTEDEAE